MNAGAIHDLILNISAIERETGLSKDVLRMWERRYGFPNPVRDDGGERQYTLADMTKLRAIKRLMDVGMRPGKVIALSVDELNALADARAPVRRDAAVPALEREVIAMLRAHDVAALQQALGQWLMRHGLQQFALDTLGPLNHAIGMAWMRGEIEIFEEHLYTEQVQAALRAGIHAFPRQSGSPRVLLTTLPGEQHGLGLLMVEAVLACEGAQCISLGTQTPQDDVRRAALAHRIDIVALSFSAAFPLRQAADSLAALRRQLPEGATLWVGGEMTRRMRTTIPGVVLLPDLAASVGALRSWRSHFAASGRTDAFTRMWTAATLWVSVLAVGFAYALAAARSIAAGGSLAAWIVGAALLYACAIAAMTAIYFALAWIFRSPRPPDMRLGLAADAASRMARILDASPAPRRG